MDVNIIFQTKEVIKNFLRCWQENSSWLCSICNNYEFKIIMWWNKGFRWMLRENWQLKSPVTDIYLLDELKWPLRVLGHWWRMAAHLVDLHSLLQGPGLRVGGSEDPELSLDQGAVGQVHSADVKVDHSVVRVGGCWLYHIWMDELEKTKTSQNSNSEERSNDVSCFGKCCTTVPLFWYSDALSRM